MFCYHLRFSLAHSLNVRWLDWMSGGLLTLSPCNLQADELICHSYYNIYSMSVTGLRFFTVYGPWGRPDMAAYKFAINIMRGKPITIFQVRRRLLWLCSLQCIDFLQVEVVEPAERLAPACLAIGTNFYPLSLKCAGCAAGAREERVEARFHIHRRHCRRHHGGASRDPALREGHCSL